MLVSSLIPYFTTAFILFLCNATPHTQAISIPHPHSGMSQFIADAIEHTFAWPYRFQNPSWDAFANLVTDVRGKGHDWAGTQLGKVKATYQDINEQIDHLSAQLQEAVEIAKHVVHDLGDGNVDWEKALDKVSEESKKIVEKLEEELTVPPPEEMDEAARRRSEQVVEFLDRIEDILVKTLSEQNMSEADARARIEPVKEKLEIVIALLAQIYCKHPELVWSVIISAFLLACPVEAVVLRALGFGSRGPVKGSIAALLQSKLFGGAIPKGSWFSWLQRLGMTLKTLLGW